MFLPTTLTKRFAQAAFLSGMLACASFAGSSAYDSVFFVQSHLQREDLLVSGFHAQTWDARWETGFRRSPWQWSLWTEAPHVKGHPTETTTSAATIGTSSPRMGTHATWRPQRQTLDAQVSFADVSDWKLEASWFWQGYRHWGAGILGTIDQQNLGFSSLQESAFPQATPSVDGSWLTHQWSTGLRLTSNYAPFALFSQLTLGGSSPRTFTQHYALVDSSLWIQAQLDLQGNWHHWYAQLEGKSLSGNMRLQGLRQYSGDYKIFALAHTGWDYNDLFLSVSPAPLAQRNATTRAPWRSLKLPHLAPGDSAPTLRLGTSWLQATLFQPNEAIGERTIWGNRIFDMDLQNLLGYSFAKSQWNLWGQATLRSYRMQAYYPWHTRFAIIWVSSEVSHWQGNIRGWNEKTLETLLDKKTEMTPMQEWFDGFLGEFAFGLQSGSLSFKVSQWVPLSLHGSVIKSTKAIGKQTFLENGLQVSLQIQRSIKMKAFQPYNSERSR